MIDVSSTEVPHPGAPAVRDLRKPTRHKKFLSSWLLSEPSFMNSL